jgi:hypothetical protein
VYVNIANHVKAIEEREQIDVTPCTDAQGNFDPAPECDQLVTVPQASTGTFPSCTVARTVEPIDSCGTLAATEAGSGGASGQPRAGAAAATRPAVALQPSAAGQPATGSATFSSTAAGGAAPEPTSASARASGCDAAASGGRPPGAIGFASLALCLLAAAGWRRLRQSRST